MVQSMKVKKEMECVMEKENFTIQMGAYMMETGHLVTWMVKVFFTTQVTR